MTTTPRMSNATLRAKRASASIHRGRLKERDSARRDWQLRLDEDETYADIQRPEYFGLSADRLVAGDRICVVSHDFSWWCELLVIDTDEALRAVKVVPLLGPVDLSQRIASVPAFDLSKARVEQVGDAWRIVLGASVVAGGFRNKGEADQHLEEIKNGRKATSKTSA